METDMDKRTMDLMSIIKSHVDSAWQDFEVARAVYGVGDERVQKYLYTWSELDEVLRDAKGVAK